MNYTDDIEKEYNHHTSAVQRRLAFARMAYIWCEKRQHKLFSREEIETINKAVNRIPDTPVLIEYSKSLLVNAVAGTEDQELIDKVDSLDFIQAAHLYETIFIKQNKR